MQKLKHIAVAAHILQKVKKHLRNVQNVYKCVQN